MPLSSHHKPKSPLILLSVLAILTVATLVVASVYFLKPNIETELKIKLVQNFANVGLFDTGIELSGRDVVLSGEVDTAKDVIKAERIANKILGIRAVTNHLVIKNQTIE